MVDVSTSLHRDRPLDDAARVSKAVKGSDVIAELFDATSLAVYREFCRNAVKSPSQHPIWIESWLKATKGEALMVTLRRDERPVMRMVLELIRRGPFLVARFPGGKHANANFPATPLGGISAVTSAEWRQIRTAVHHARRDVAILELERSAPSLDGIDNPLAPHAQGESPNIALAADLGSGFEALLDRNNGKKKRRKQKSQERKYIEAGGFRIITCESPACVDRLFGEFLALKAERFAKMGIPDVYAEPHTRAFFNTLFKRALEEEEPSFAIDALEVGGEIKAVNGLLHTRQTTVCQFGAIREDELKTSPGFTLDYMNIQNAAEKGLAMFDFGVGDEAYKRSWCEIEIRHFDILAPLSLRGRILGHVNAARSKAVGALKRNEKAWAAVKALRTRLAGRSSS
jgi:CelD/BcsL family acetyltransferase involved in cellulose biosynthesis